MEVVHYKHSWEVSHCVMINSHYWWLTHVWNTTYCFTQLMKCISSNGLNFNIRNTEWEGTNELWSPGECEWPLIFSIVYRTAGNPAINSCSNCQYNQFKTLYQNDCLDMWIVLLANWIILLTTSWIDIPHVMHRVCGTTSINSYLK